MTSFRIALLSIWIGLCVFLQGCDESRQQGIDILHIEGATWVCNVNTSYAVFGSLAESEELLENTLPASAGDLIYMLHEDLELYYRYSPENGTRYAVSFDTLGATKVYMNGQLSYMELSGPESISQFSALTEAEIEQLQALNISSALSSELISTLKEHEGSLQGTGLILEGSPDADHIQDLLSIVRPRFLVLGGSAKLPEPEANISMSNLELLWIDGHIYQLAKLARCCSGLESLIVAEWEPEQGELLPLNSLKNLKSLTIAESKLTSLSSVDFPESLQKLYLVSCDTLSDMDGLPDLPRLEHLSLALCKSISNPNVLLDLDPLQSISLPPEISQSEFRELTRRMNQLAMVELIDCEKIQDLSPLRELPDLKILQLQLKKDQLGGLDSLRQLDLIILTDDVFIDNPEFINELRAALPETRIVPGSGICLGSGWLLLLIPFVLIVRYWQRHKS
jgi:hypothetical protein